MQDVEATARLTSFLACSHMVHCCRSRAAPAGHSSVKAIELLQVRGLEGSAEGRALTLLVDVKPAQLPAATCQV
jgi:hypothetical protein